MKKKLLYHKLVRDRIPEIIERENKGFQVSQVDAAKLRQYAFNKLREEVEEFIENPCAEEAADIQEILEFICHRQGIRSRTINAQKVAKYATKGGFEMGYILEGVEE